MKKKLCAIQIFWERIIGTSSKLVGEVETDVSHKDVSKRGNTEVNTDKPFNCEPKKHY